MSIVTYNNRSIANISAIPGAAKSLTHIKTLTASSSSTLSFVNGSDDVVLDSTYPIYLFKIINCHAASDSVRFTVNFRDGSTDYDATKTSTYFRARHDESGSTGQLGYDTGEDLAQSTGEHTLCASTGNDNDQCLAGTLTLFNPSSTTFVKHFISDMSDYRGNNYNAREITGGYCNTTTAIDGVRFKMGSGNIDAGTIKLYGLKDS